MNLFNRSQDAVTNLRINYDGKEAERGLGNLKKLAGTVISVYALKQLATYTWELAKLGAEAQNVEKNFANFAKARNRSVDDMMKQLHKATMGMVDDMQLQQRAMQAMVGGVKFDDMIVAMEYVTKFAAATGQDVNVKMQTTMTGLARKSAQFLDDIGIQVMGSKDVINDAINQMKEKMDQFSTSEEDASVKAQTLIANIQNMKNSISQLLVPAFSKLIDVVNEAALGWEYLFNINKKAIDTETIPRLSKEMRELTANIEMAERTGSKMVTWLSDGVFRTEALGVAKAELKAIREQIVGINKAVQGGPGKPIEPGGGGIDEEAEKRAKKLREMLADEDLETRKAALKEMEQLEDEHQKELDWIYQRGYERRMEIQQGADSIEEQLLQQTAEGRKQLAYRSYLENYMILEQAGRNTTELDTWIQTELTRIDKEESDKRVKQTEEEFQKKLAIANNFMNLSSGLINSLQNLSNAYTQNELNNLDEEHMSRRKYEKEKKKIMDEANERNRRFARLQQIQVLARAISDAYAASIGAAKDTFGGPISRGIAGSLVLAKGLTEVAVIEAQMNKFQRGYLGEVSRMRNPDNMYAMIGKNEAVIPGPQYAMHEEDVRAIVNNTANTASGLRRLQGGSVVNQFYGLSDRQISAVIRDQNRRNYTGKLI